MIWRPWRRQIQSETASLCRLSTHRIGKGRSDAVQDNGRDRNLDKRASTQILFIGLAVLIGLGSSLQVSMVAAMGRMRGPLEATWVSFAGKPTGHGYPSRTASLATRRTPSPRAIRTVLGIHHRWRALRGIVSFGSEGYRALLRPHWTASHSLLNWSRISWAAAWGRPVFERGHRRTDDWLRTAGPRRSIWPRCSESHCISSTWSRSAYRRGQPHSRGSVMHQNIAGE